MICQHFYQQGMLDIAEHLAEVFISLFLISATNCFDMVLETRSNFNSLIKIFLLNSNVIVPINAESRFPVLFSATNV